MILLRWESSQYTSETVSLKKNTVYLDLMITECVSVVGERLVSPLDVCFVVRRLRYKLVGAVTSEADRRTCMALILGRVLFYGVLLILVGHRSGDRVCD